jgi:outer membrane receptor protein involved in Fe transport
VGARWAAIRGAWRLRATGLARRLTPFASSTGDASVAGGATLSASYSPSASREASLEIGGVAGDTYMIPTQSVIDRFEAEIGYVRAQGRLGLGGPGSPYGHLKLDVVWNGGAVRSSTFPRAVGGGFHATYHTPYARLHHELRGTLRGVRMQARWGGEVRLNTLDSTITRGERDLWNVAAFASNEAEIGRWRLTAGLRLDRSTLTRVHLSPRLSAVWSPVDGHQLRAAFNTGYNDAHLLHYFADMDLDPMLHLGSNPDLEAERVVYGEIGWTGVLTGSSRAFATAFAYRLTDWISLDPPTAVPAEIRYRNNEALEVFGGETGVEIAIRRTVSAYASYALVGPANARVEPYGTNGHASPQHKIGAGARIDLPSGTYLTADAQLFGPSEVRALPEPGELSPTLYVPVQLERFVMVHARAGHAFASGLDLSVAASNTADDPTRHFKGAERPERRVMATVAYYR